MPQKETFASPWRALADRWEKYYTPPGRPSVEDCKRYADYVERSLHGKSGRALVLGSTPEIRNVLHRFPLEVTVLDINLEMILGMNRFVAHADRDILVRGSWVDAPLRSDYYDIVLGDLSWSNVPMELWQKFNKNLVRMLKSSGHYIHRLYVIPEYWQVQSVREVVTEYARLPFTTQRHLEMFLKLLTDTFDQKNRVVSLFKIWKGVSEFWKDGKFVSGKEIAGGGILLRRLLAFWGSAKKEWQTGTPKQLRKDLTPYFEVLEESFSSDYRCAATTPFWFCKVKK